MTRPVIAVGGRRIPAEKIDGWRDHVHGAAAQYLEALHRAGARGVILPAMPVDEAEAREVLSRFDGVLLTGGGDIEPAVYGAGAHEKTYDVDEERDAFELAISRAALDSGMPFLGVCRGLQVLNVALGGTLVQHIPEISNTSHKGSDVPDAQEHIKIEPGSRLAEALGSEEVEGMGSHHQAVDRLGQGLRPVAWAEDGLIEGAEAEDGWVVAVQWHPERAATEDPVQQRLFGSFVSRCRT